MNCLSLRSSVTPTLRSDMQVSQAVLLSQRERNFLPVFEPGTRNCMGVISTWDANALRGERM